MSSIRRKTKEEFIQDARKVWGNQYDYSQVDYVNSRTKVLIRCIKHDETFQQTPFAHIIMKRQGCPKCQEIRKKRTKYKKLLPIAKYADYIKEWDYEKNGDIKPEYIPCTSQKKFYWKCEKGHSWKAQVNTRLMGHGCPHCAGIILTPGENDLLSQNPELVKEWDYDRNGDLTPDKITVNNSKRVWWVCKTCGHHWAVGVAHRNKGEGCPQCADKQRTLSKHKRIVALKGSFADNYPQLLKEWDYVRNGGLDPKTLPPHCGKKVWWICRTCGHSWQATMDARAKGRGCTKCADKQRTLSRRKKFIELKGAFADTHPHLIKDWDYSKNEGTPNDYSAGSHYRASWKCHHCGYEWEVSISKRTVGHKCPNCHK